MPQMPRIDANRIQSVTKNDADLSALRAGLGTSPLPRLAAVLFERLEESEGETSRQIQEVLENPAPAEDVEG